MCIYIRCYIFALVWESIWGQVELTFVLLVGFPILRDGHYDWICIGVSGQTKKMGTKKKVCIHEINERRKWVEWNLVSSDSETFRKRNDIHGPGQSQIICTKDWLHCSSNLFSHVFCLQLHLFCSTFVLEWHVRKESLIVISSLSIAEALMISKCYIWIICD